MTRLINELTNEHSILADTIIQVNKLGFNTKEGQKALLSAKSALLMHLKKEDKQLYPVLKKEAEKDPGLKRNLDMFASDMDAISQTALEFFDKYSEGGSGLEFAKDYGRLTAILTNRISREENIIYKKFNELYL